MAKRDPNKTDRNKQIAAMKAELRVLLPQVLKETGIKNEQQLNARIGHKTDHFIDLKNDVIVSPDQFVSQWIDGFKTLISTTGDATVFGNLYGQIKGSPAFKKYLHVFLRRSFLNHYDELHKKRPHVKDAEIWIGENNADYGLLVSPRFVNGAWENDKSEIRHFKPAYWTVGHVIKTGLVVPNKNKKMNFATVEDYLTFFEHVLVRQTASPHQKDIAARYVDYVRASPEPEKVPLLIPELRYDGPKAKHKYRLDFCVIDPHTMAKTGFELSPWSTHGKLTGTKNKTQKAINAEASANFEAEMKKHKDFFKKHGVFALIYTDSDLANPSDVFADIAHHLKPNKPAKQVSFQFLDNFFK